jgi:hypothetical protein
MKGKNCRRTYFLKTENIPRRELRRVNLWGHPFARPVVCSMSSRDRALSLFRQLYRAAGGLPTVRDATSHTAQQTRSPNAKKKKTEKLCVSVC